MKDLQAKVEQVYNTRRCWICGRFGNCLHREPAVETALLQYGADWKPEPERTRAAAAAESKPGRYELPGGGWLV